MTFDTPSPWLSKFRFDPITSGAFRGTYALQGNLSSRSTGGTAEHRLALVEEVLSSPAAAIRKRIFRLTLDDALSEENVFRASSFCETLHQFGWGIHIVFDGFSLPDSAVKDILSGAQWIVIKTTSNIVSFGGNEFWYLPAPKEPLKDPTFPMRLGPGGSVLYLSPKDLDEAVVLDFLSRSRYDWNVLL